MILDEEIRQYAADLGVPEGQIKRDHLISHVLNAVSGIEARNPDLELGFFGGTALCRTWCPDIRLSEDIDLLIADLASASERVLPEIVKDVRQEYPDCRWLDGWVRNDLDSKVLQDGFGSEVRVQFVKWRQKWRHLTFRREPVALRYSDLPTHVEIPIPSATAFVAMKLMAWEDRKAPRDLFDLYFLSRKGFFSTGALDLVEKVTGVYPTIQSLGISIPKITLRNWQAELAHQTQTLPEPSICIEQVCRELENLRNVR